MDYRVLTRINPNKMKALKVIEKNYDEITEVITNVENNCRARTIYNFTSVTDYIKEAEKLFQKHRIPKNRWIGAIVKNMCELPNAYKYDGQYTAIRIERRKTGWYLLDVRREDCVKTSGGNGYFYTIISPSTETVNYIKEKLYKESGFAY